MKLLSFGLLLIIVSCAPVDPPPVPSAPPSPGGSIVNRWGRYSQPIRVQFLHPRNMSVYEEVTYSDPWERKWVAKKGDEFNGASIPRAAWSILGGPFDDAYRDAALFHDLAYQRRTSRWQDADSMFYYAMRCSGVGSWKAKTMFTAVWLAPNKWPEPPTANDQVFSLKPVFKTRTIPSPEVTEEDVRAIGEWIKSEDPSLEEIKAKFPPGANGVPTRAALMELNARF